MDNNNKNNLTTADRLLFMMLPGMLLSIIGLVAAINIFHPKNNTVNAFVAFYTFIWLIGFAYYLKKHGVIRVTDI